ncbi:MAG: hypothetical protein M3326_09600 [Actinomycetota bacterium]|nr:hypothetical protein [Actinomycetota bacterium]
MSSGARIASVNGQAGILFGWRRGDLVGQQVEVLGPERSAGSHSLVGARRPATGPSSQRRSASAQWRPRRAAPDLAAHHVEVVVAEAVVDRRVGLRVVFTAGRVFSEAPVAGRPLTEPVDEDTAPQAIREAMHGRA